MSYILLTGWGTRHLSAIVLVTRANLIYYTPSPTLLLSLRPARTLATTGSPTLGVATSRTLQGGAVPYEGG
jgi:hypothetical protein